MSTPASTIPTFTAWFMARLAARVTAVSGSSFHIGYGPDGISTADDLIRVQTGEREVTPLAVVGDLGQWSLQEQFQVVSTVSVFRGGGNFQVAEARAWSMVNGVETVVRADLFGAIHDGTAATAFGGNVWNVEIAAHAPALDWTENKGVLIEIPYVFTVFAAI